MLEAGRVSTATHVEHMALDQGALWAAAFPGLAEHRRRFGGLTFIDRLRLGGALLYEAHGRRAWARPTGEADTVRAWRAFSIAAADLPLEEALAAARPFAEDDHFAVREWAWLAVRDTVRADPPAAVRWLSPTLLAGTTRWRRFASEVTRPRSVWGRHIGLFKAEPWLAEPVLVPLLAEADRYVLVSVTNWLNDVCGQHPAWVLAMCARMAVDTPDWFARRATRTAAADAT